MAALLVDMAIRVFGIIAVGNSCWAVYTRGIMERIIGRLYMSKNKPYSFTVCDNTIYVFEKVVGEVDKGIDIVTDPF
jgi:hypothetical protein